MCRSRIQSTLLSGPCQLPVSGTFGAFVGIRFFRFYFEGLGRAALDGLLGPIHVPFVTRATLYTVVAFGMSGVLH
jgi:hypothetical protein